MIPWMIWLSSHLPTEKVVPGWRDAWVGLDVLEAAGLFGTGVLLIRRNDAYRLTAVATAALLVVDAWFDVVTAAPGSERGVAVLMALFAELPTAAGCLYLCRHRPVEVEADRLDRAPTAGFDLPDDSR